MRLKCRCGRFVSFESADVGGPVQCPDCGRSYAISRGADGKLRARAARGRGETGSAAAGEWPDDLELAEPQTGPAAAPAEEAPPGEWSGELELETALPQQAPALRGDATVTRATPPSPRPAAAPAAPAGRSWWYYLATARMYPFTGTVKWTLLGWAVWAAILPLWLPWLALGLLYGVMLQLIVLLGTGGVILLYEFEVIRQSAWDASAAPRLPRYEGFYESALRPIGHLLAILLGSFVPLLLAAFVGRLPGAPAWWRIVIIGALLVSLFMVPMNMLAVATADYAWAINPRFTFPGVVRIIEPYVVFYVFALIVLGVGSVLWKWLQTQPSFFLRLGAMVFQVYLWTILARALGTLHYVYSDKIGWTRDVE